MDRTLSYYISGRKKKNTEHRNESWNGPPELLVQNFLIAAMFIVQVVFAHISVEILHLRDLLSRRKDCKKCDNQATEPALHESYVLGIVEPG